MVAGVIAQGIYNAGKLIFRYRKQIYSVVSAQDRYIKGAFVGTRVSKSAQYGWRSGAAIGGLVGSYIKLDADDSPGNGIQTKKPVITTRTPYKTRYRPTRSNRPSGEFRRTSNNYCRRPNARRY